MKRFGATVRLDLPDLIRMNRLVRGSIDMAGFERWYRELQDDERRALVDTLIAYACEAVVDGAVYDEAMSRAGLDPPWVDRASERFWTDASRPDPRWQGLPAVRAQIRAAARDDLPRWLRWAVFIFGVAEGRTCVRSPGTCDHWWHRDLTDERVVADLMRGRTP